MWNGIPTPLATSVRLASSLSDIIILCISGRGGRSVSDGRRMSFCDVGFMAKDIAAPVLRDCVAVSWSARNRASARRGIHVGG